jgi:mRNA-degrading endonuclease toxin of MazEF toxin-antitoxin module
MQCPLPIDWLEYVEGAGSEALESHLHECLSCQILVAKLRAEHRPVLRAGQIRSSSAWPQWVESREVSPKLGDVWWTRLAPGAGKSSAIRLLVLVVSDLWKDKGDSWCDVIPLKSDVENATSLDLTLSPSETDLNVPWRVLLRRQTVASSHDLSTRVGALTAGGLGVVQRALEGEASEERFGPSIEDPEDLRLRNEEDFDNAIRDLGRPYAVALESGEAVSDHPRVLQFPLHRVQSPQRMLGSLQLAADTNAKEEKFEWAVDLPNNGSIQGRIDYQYLEDKIVFVVENVVEAEKNLHLGARFIFWSERLSEPIESEEFVPASSKIVLLGQDLGVLPKEINRLELRLSDE